MEKEVLWTELGRATLLDAYMRKVDEVHYQMPTGERATFNIAVEGPVVGVLALTPDNQVILTKQFRPGPAETLWELPGGFIDKGENPAQTASRELLEETGYQGELRAVGKTFADAYSTKVRHYFVATNCRRVGEQQLDGREFIEVTLVPLEKFREILRSGQMSDVAGGYMALDALGLL